jgi:hypothetical protein
MRSLLSTDNRVTYNKKIVLKIEMNRVGKKTYVLQNVAFPFIRSCAKQWRPLLSFIRKSWFLEAYTCNAPQIQMRAPSKRRVRQTVFFFCCRLTRVEHTRTRHLRDVTDGPMAPLLVRGSEKICRAERNDYA